MTTRDGRYLGRNVRWEPPDRAIRISGDAHHRLTKLEARMSHLGRRSNELQRASARLRAHSREVLARAHELVRAAGAPRQSNAGSDRMSNPGVK